MRSATLRPAAARAALLWSVAALTVLTVAARVAQELTPGSVTANALHFFDATFEQSVPTLFSTLLLMACAALLAAVAAGATAQRGRWWLLCAVLAFLALDEAVGFHEASVPPLRRLFDATGFLYLTWVVPGAVFVVLLVVAVRPLARELSSRERRALAAAAVLFFGGAIGLELVEGRIIDEHGESAAGLIPVATTQELLEMLGAVLFLIVLMERLVPWAAALRLEPDP